MTNTLKMLLSGVLGGLVVLLLSGVFTPDRGIGGVYSITEQYFTSGIDVVGTADLNGSVEIGSSAATSSVNFGRACWTVTANDGDTTYVFFNGTGSLATSSSSCN